MPNESAESGLIWMPCSGADVSSYEIPPRAVWFNDVAIYQCETINPDYTNIPGATGTVFINIPVRGYESGCFTRVLTAAGAELGSLTAAYFVW
jgi:hypothetical protein